jgi:hypothetical protein
LVWVTAFYSWEVLLLLPNRTRLVKISDLRYRDSLKPIPSFQCKVRVYKLGIIMRMQPIIPCDIPIQQVTRIARKMDITAQVMVNYPFFLEESAVGGLGKALDTLVQAGDMGQDDGYRNS